MVRRKSKEAEPPRLQQSSRARGAAHDTPGPPEASWKHRLQSVSLRTKIVVPMVLLAIIPAATVGIFAIFRMQGSLRQSAIQRLKFDTASKAQAIHEFLETVQQDLKFLSLTREVQELARTKAEPERVGLLRQKVEQEFLVFSQGKRAYYQVRYLNSAGYEVVRLNVEDGTPMIVSVGELQDKSSRYYVSAALAMEPGEIYVSPMDLNVEHEKVERPARSVVRYATVVAGEGGARHGLVLINVYADYILSLLDPLTPGTEAWLIDQEGTYLGYVGESNEKRNLFSLQKRRRLPEDHARADVESILSDASQALAIRTGNTFLSRASVAYDRQNPNRKWILMMGHPQAPIEQPIKRMTVFLSVVMSLIIAVSAVLGVLIGDYLAGPIVRLQQATRDIANGDLKRPVNIKTGDEIEKLADDFNVMTERLREARDRLSSWNEALRREVERQTHALHRLQSGMAHAEKLASIGQITAGVMHEIGNPLAAIKTKIQMAGEDEGLCGECRALLGEITKEVDRLAAFLRSFSRLSRIGGQRIKEDVSLVEVAESVIGLVSVDLRGKGITVRCESERDVPAVRGVADQLRQLVMNLLLNAADALPDGGEILVRLRPVMATSAEADEPAMACVEVVDRGEGIAPEVMDKIWDPFFTNKQNGTGLGLAICRQIVEEHGGVIHIESQAGQGVVARVTFPASDTITRQHQGH